MSSKYLNEINDRAIEPGPALMGLAWSSRAALAIAPLQDLLNLGREARMNVPGRAGGNWRWRYTDEMLTDKPFARLRDLTANSKRIPDAETVVAGESGAVVRLTSREISLDSRTRITGASASERTCVYPQARGTGANRRE